MAGSFFAFFFFATLPFFFESDNFEQGSFRLGLGVFLREITRFSSLFRTCLAQQTLRLDFSARIQHLSDGLSQTILNTNPFRRRDSVLKAKVRVKIRCCRVQYNHLLFGGKWCERADPAPPLQKK